jgi:phosphopantetheine adenylyltransferase
MRACSSSVSVACVLLSDAMYVHAVQVCSLCIIIRKLRAEQDYIKEAHFASLAQFTIVILLLNSRQED